ncbi:MAG: hypothetical protein R3190_05580 [Thermoanaerobaculia bacterium]|nr:hypothetical protein [Thermoanaerobaculia bacterium]
MGSSYEWIGFLLVSGLALVVAVALGSRLTHLWPPVLLLGAVAARILGATLRYEVLFVFYRGTGDALRYYNDSLPLVEALRSFDVSVLNPSFWLLDTHRWGTGFIVSLSSAVLWPLGPSLRGEFVVFSLLSFLGLYAIATAFARVQFERRIVYAAWIWFFPSLWFWPSSVGKESVLLLAIGIATLGYVGRRDKIGWAVLAAGVGLAFLVRPHVAAVLALSVGVAEWLRSWQRMTARRAVEMAVIAIVGVGVLAGMSTQLVAQRPEFDNLTDLMLWQRDQTEQGGSNIGAAPLTPAGVPMAFVNIWMRPFLWEAHNLTALFAAAEITAFWGLVLWRRRETWAALRNWRRHRLLRFGLPFLLGYTLMIGIAFGNLGIIARQRTLIFPFMLMFLLAVPELGPRRGARARV